MPLGGGKYDPEVTELRERLKADGVLLIVFGGSRGTGFCAQLPLEQAILTPEILEDVAKQIRGDRGKFPASTATIEVSGHVRCPRPVKS